MPASTATAPGKIILFGEHAVVYGQPAVAVPVTQVQARATVHPKPAAPAGEVRIQAPAIGLDARLDDLPADQPLAAAVRGLMQALGLPHLPALTLRVTSTIPVAAGLGSGAAVSVAVLRALGRFLGRPLSDEQVNALAYEVEKLHHGTPSGIDNTVITYARPVFFIRGRPIETFQVRRPFTLLIADTGVPSPTAETVGAVRRAWQAEPARYERLFAAMGSLARAARQAIEDGHPERLGPLMNENHDLLRETGVSSPELEHLVNAARQAGALGAKLSGGGGGGNMIALPPLDDPHAPKRLAAALQSAGAARVLITPIGQQQQNQP